MQSTCYLEPHCRKVVCTHSLSRKHEPWRSTKQKLSHKNLSTHQHPRPPPVSFLSERRMEDMTLYRLSPYKLSTCKIRLSPSPGAHRLRGASRDQNILQTERGLLRHPHSYPSRPWPYICGGGLHGGGRSGPVTIGGRATCTPSMRLLFQEVNPRGAELWYRQPWTTCHKVSPRGVAPLVGGSQTPLQSHHWS